VSAGGPLDFEPDERDSGRAPAPPPPTPEPPPAPPPPRAPAGISRYGWFLGVVVVLLIVLGTLASRTGDRPEAGGPKRGERMPAFAVPLATSDTDAGANLLSEPNEGTPAACDVRSPDALNLCREYAAGPVVLALFFTGPTECRAALGQLERVRPRAPRARFLAVGIAGDREKLRERRWSFPVGHDPDGYVGQRYGLVGCRQLVFARRGGRVVEIVRGELDDAALMRRVRALT
jgi:hypothetical protein